MVLTNQLSPLLDSGWVEETARRQFEPLLDSAFADVLRRHYPYGVTVDVDGRALTNVDSAPSERVPIAIRLGRRRNPSALGYLEQNASARPDREGIAISTFGKVIKRGWDWLGLTPTGHGRITGLIEAPDLAACLTLSKNDFIRSGARGATYLAFRKAIQEVVSRQLAAWGDRHDEPPPRMARLERDLERVLEDLAEDFPLLRSLVDRRAGGQKRLPMPGRGSERVPAPLFANVPAGDEASDARAGSGARGGSAVSEEPATSTPEPSVPSSPRPESGQGQPREGEPVTLDEGHTHAHAAAAGALDTIAGRRRPARYGLLVQFESRPGELELGRLVDSTIWINDAHPAYTRAVGSRSLGYHTALTLALALAPLAVEPSQEHSFLTQFLAQWGGSPTGTRSARRRHSRR
jgi:hypothetical protein